MTEFVLWGTPKDETDALYEQPLTTRNSKKDCEFVQKIAAKDGWHSFRIVQISKPNFGANLLAA